MALAPLALALLLVSVSAAEARWLQQSTATPTLASVQAQVASLQASLLSVSTSLFGASCVANTLFYAANGLPVGVAPASALASIVSLNSAAPLVVTLCKGTLLTVSSPLVVSTSSTLTIGCSTLTAPPSCKLDGGHKTEIMAVNQGSVTLTGLTFQARLGPPRDWRIRLYGGLLALSDTALAERDLAKRRCDRHFQQRAGADRAVLVPHRRGRQQEPRRGRRN